MGFKPTWTLLIKQVYSFLMPGSLKHNLQMPNPPIITSLTQSARCNLLIFLLAPLYQTLAKFSYIPNTPLNKGATLLQYPLPYHILIYGMLLSSLY